MPNLFYLMAFAFSTKEHIELINNYNLIVMANAVFNLPEILNEPVLSYIKGSAERNKLTETIKELKSKVIDIPMYIGGKRVTSEQKVDIRPPHELKHLLLSLIHI